MTARPDIVALPVTATLEHLVSQIETSGHSRLPIMDGDVDHILGILYARDLITILGDAKLRQNFELRKCLRQVLYIPESKPLKDLLQEFRLRKVHMAIVLDEFGGTAGLITIEDVLEELVGEISDEHEPAAPPALQKLDDATWDIDASTYIDEVNTVVGLKLPEDDGYETLAGYISSTLGRIPEAGEEFETPGAMGSVETNSQSASYLTHWKVLDAEPTRVKRIRLTLRPVVAEEHPAEGVGSEVEGS
jgi:CBS domain containing-hemolysin-like protein